MSSFYDLASLVMIPSGKKAGKVYSQKPLTTDGQLDFTRASTATRIGSDGKIEKTRTNLLTYSNDFSNAAWVKTNTTFSGDTLTASSGTAFKAINQSESTQGIQVNYFDVAYTNHQWVQILFGTTGSDIGFTNFDIQNKVIGGGSGFVDATIQDFGTYVRISIVANTSAKSAAFLAFVNSSSSVRAESTSSTGSFKLLRSQTEQGLVATDYINTTTAAVSVGSVDNMPRLNYTPGSATSCPALLLEPQRTNLIEQSEYTDGANWSNEGAITDEENTSETTSPEGLYNAVKLVSAISTSEQWIQASGISVTSGNDCTISCFVKKSDYNYFLLRFTGIGGSFVAKSIWFNISDGTLGTIQTGVTGTIEDYGNGWYRISATKEVIGTGSAAVRFQLASSDNNSSVVGDGSKGTYVYGCQAELGSYPTSYIPTFGATVTRVADACSKTGISGLIGQTEGTLFAEFEIGLDNAHFFLYTNTNNCIYIQTKISDVFKAYVVNGGVYQVAITTGTVPSSGFVKMAFAYKENDFALYANGNLIQADTSGSVPSCDSYDFGLGPFGSGFSAKQTKKTMLFKTRLTNTQLAELTSLDS